ncbi:hypothetical protein C0993_009632 [Termitomyces sp. T159_Od127]|nr:hypothetical protein C0993_009632 [Termitomyces sp. T159_Od127]
MKNVDRALLSCLHKLPPSYPSYNDFPSASNRERKLEQGRTGEVRSEYRVQLIYEEAVARFCAVVAGTLEFGLEHWKYGFLEWSRERLSNRRIPGVKATDAVADGFLNLAETDEYGNHYHLTPRQRDVYKIFPELAIWEFKNLNFSHGEDEEKLDSGEVFNEIVNGFLTGIFPWEGCKEGDDCPLKHPKIGATACPMGYDAVNSPCSSYDIARKEAIARRDWELQEDVQYVTIKTKKQDSARRILQQASGCFAWAEAVVVDVTFIIIQAGNIEIICMRDRTNQSLYVTNVFNTGGRDYPYHKLHTGLYIAAFRDAEDRASRIERGEIPFTWKMESGPDMLKVSDYRDLKNDHVSTLLLQEIRMDRKWLKVSVKSSAPPASLAFIENVYKRVDDNVPEDYDDYNASVAIIPTGNLRPTITQDLHTGSQSFLALKTDVRANKSRLKFYEYFELVIEDLIHEQDICRARVEVPGVILSHDFQHADSSIVILKAARHHEGILRLIREYRTLQYLEASLTPNIPKTYGLYLSPGLSSLYHTFCALVLHDQGISLAQILSESPRRRFTIITDQSNYQSLDVSIVGFGRAKTPGFDHPDWPPPGGVPSDIMKKMEEERQILRALLNQASSVREEISQRTSKRAKEVGKAAEPAVKKTLYHGRVRH